MPHLTTKYAPQRIEEFIGLDEPRRVLAKYLKAPYPAAFAFVGDSGTGKTKMAEVVARSLNPDNPFTPQTYIHVGSGKCNVEKVRQIEERLDYLPWGWWVVHIDEINEQTAEAQIAWLSVLDRIPPKTVFLFTCNDTAKLEPRFLSRCMQLKFSNYGLNGTGSAFLREIWRKEASGDIASGNNEPDFARVLKNQRNNIRGALTELESLILRG